MDRRLVQVTNTVLQNMATLAVLKEKGQFTDEEVTDYIEKRRSEQRSEEAEGASTEDEGEIGGSDEGIPAS